MLNYIFKITCAILVCTTAALGTKTVDDAQETFKQKYPLATTREVQIEIMSEFLDALPDGKACRLPTLTSLHVEKKGDAFEISGDRDFWSNNSVRNHVPLYVTFLNSSEHPQFFHFPVSSLAEYLISLQRVSDKVIRSRLSLLGVFPHMRSGSQLLPQ